MTDRPIIFSAPMIRALLDGRKTQTRRILKTQPEPWAERVNVGPVSEVWRKDGIAMGMTSYGGERSLVQIGNGGETMMGLCKSRFMPGDRLWVRENFQLLSFGDYAVTKRQPCEIRYAATERLADCSADVRGYPWRPSIYMPRWASRITLVVTDVRVQRLHDIDHRDACAEGWPGDEIERAKAEMFNDCDDTCIEWFADLWETINGPGAWDANPWVTAISFNVHKSNIDKAAG